MFTEPDVIAKRIAKYAGMARKRGEIKIDCECLQRVEARGKTWSGSFYAAIWQDCSDFVEDLMRYAENVCYRPAAF